MVSNLIINLKVHIYAFSSNANPYHNKLPLACILKSISIVYSQLTGISMGIKRGNVANQQRQRSSKSSHLHIESVAKLYITHFCWLHPLPLMKPLMFVAYVSLCISKKENMIISNSNTILFECWNMALDDIRTSYRKISTQLNHALTLDSDFYKSKTSSRSLKSMASSTSILYEQSTGISMGTKKGNWVM